MREELFLKLKIGVVVTIIIGYTIYIIVKQSKSKKEGFPIIKAKCPDYWEVVSDNKCKNVQKIGDCNNTDDNLVIDFNDKTFQDAQNGDYFKCVWARNCNVSWQGIDLKCT